MDSDHLLDIYLEHPRHYTLIKYAVVGEVPHNLMIRNIDCDLIQNQFRVDSHLNQIPNSKVLQK